METLLLAVAIIILVLTYKKVEAILKLLLIDEKEADIK
ncbi:MAG: hypothetical protein JWP06_140 [Candidatus Saccharibacteria bacterium]|nr:hypothetical protein [Candidatus Saccharibacteria bacterium]